jgi:hypothetical protein
MSAITTKIAITFPTRLAARLKEKAAFEFGFDIPEIVRKLVADYVTAPTLNSEYLTPGQEAKYLSDIEETKKSLKKNQAPVAQSLKELKKQIESDTF